VILLRMECGLFYWVGLCFQDCALAGEDVKILGKTCPAP